MKSTSVRLAAAALLVVGAATAGCARSTATAPASPVRSVTTARSEVPAVFAPPPSCAAPARAVAAAPAVERIPHRVVARAPERAPEAAPATSLPAAPPSPPAPLTAPSSPVRLINVTCPVMLGNPVDPAVTSSWQGRLVAFSDVAARTRWEHDPARFAANLPGWASGTSSDASAPTVARVVAGPAASATLRRAAPSPIGPPAAFVGSPDGDEEEPVLEPEFDEECCPGGNCRLPGR
jgi:hypothetical protein